MPNKETILESNDVSIDRWPDTKILILKSMDDYAKEVSIEFAIFRDEFKREELKDLHEYQKAHGIIGFIPTRDSIIYHVYLQSK